MNSSTENERSWVFLLPSQLASFLLAVTLVSSQFNPCDATSVSLGSSLPFILFSMVIGFLVSLDSVLNPSSRSNSFDRGVRGPIKWLYAFLILFGLWLWVCTSLVPGKGNARFATNGCWQWIAEGGLTLSVASLCSRYRIGVSTISLMLGCATGTVASAGYQYFVSMPSLRQKFAVDPNSFFEKMGVLSGSSDALQLSSRLGSLEPTGTFALTNSLAGFMATWLVFVVVLLVGQLASVANNSERKKADLGGFFLIGGLAVAFFATLLLTKGRSAWLATLVCVIASGMLHPALRMSGWAVMKRFQSVILSVVVLVSIAIGSILLRDPTVIAEAGKSLSYRLDYWHGAVSLIGAEPWTGYGVANFQHNYDRIKLVTASESPADPHNFLLETAVTGGVPLLMILCAVLGVIFIRLIVVAKMGAKPSNPFGVADPTLCMADGLIFLGALCGCGGTVFFESLVNDIDGLISSLLFAGFTLFIGLSVHFVLVRRRWFLSNASSVVTCLISALAVLFHLLASGGWMQPGVMNSFCVLVGLAFGLSVGYPVEVDNVKGGVSQKQTDPMGRWVSKALAPIACLLIVVIAIADFARTMVSPTLAASSLKSLIENDPKAVRDPSQWLEMIQLDPLDPELPSMAAEQLVEQLVKSNLSESSKQKYMQLLDTFCEAYLQRDANQWLPYSQCGKWNLNLADSIASNSPSNGAISRRDLALQYYVRSAELYPNSAQAQLQAAVVSAWCGKTGDAIEYREKAEGIDRETPHEDRKLSAVIVNFPKSLQEAYGALEVQEKLPPGYAKGEPTVRWLRTYIR